MKPSDLFYLYIQITKINLNLNRAGDNRDIEADTTDIVNNVSIER